MYCGHGLHQGMHIRIRYEKNGHSEYHGARGEIDCTCLIKCSRIVLSCPSFSYLKKVASQEFALGCKVCIHPLTKGR